ncbi:hypothetical protein COW36_09350 [bacterium (Candidatus Blackallbacteria) CG17_big_fil_post_rev_8_21_14_2_50_48_46]|uniref:RNA-directed DNA polymerase n=1 Tax=bacterium (Candidatus Blackallbacteria) CG17_big_fil_post_rev_8_21_14_2_50_48_46 TaxID=2014261 RepID=A0A2M7G5U5_9BACT|nr:MAG: hypothetical protein COW64_23700 [bacterium (Candidatus Blackallbacteria) CG18_big_fil_WC_8_21_14_2_50_49_26]PIW17371.1 MAG: hypothetical protein COW36_09350 [bacterium (Candidatus Blackallbacteria) CG17_big_fil_post_rev_8_21_14_2_50_48_46]PIW47397.1 MAG: hypothetical protein COW20_12480 [bacterium (Candidatus Blackallbacteria) CG13_big_fil_rev_8_21_14_2_50_49_14]
MKRLSRPEFINLIDNDTFIEFTAGKIFNIPSSGVVEFQLSNKFFYKLRTDIKLWSFLRVIHSNLNKNFLKKISLNSSAIAFRSGLSYINFFSPHIENYFFLRLDIKSFFHSISKNLINNVFSSYFRDEFIDKNSQISLLEYFIFLTTLYIDETYKNNQFKYQYILPMGFSTSPLISNIVFRSIDIQISNICLEYGVTYTRYADDMLFSMPKNANPHIQTDVFYVSIKSILSKYGFFINKHKVISKKNTISINGYTLQNTPNMCEFRVSNKKIKIIQKIIYEYNKNTEISAILKKCFKYNIIKRFTTPEKVPNNLVEKYNKHQLINKIAGYRAFLLSFILFNHRSKLMSIETSNKYLNLINELEKIMRNIYLTLD